LEVQREEIDLQTLVKGVFEQYAYMDNAGLIDKQIHIKAPVPFYSDRRRLTVILNNLISNAIRYSSPRREHPYIKVSIKINEEKGEFVVEDNGIGIEEKHLPRIFDMFYRATQDQAGSGLGLYIVKETIEKLGGQISLKSKYGEGTTFRFVVPNLLNKTPHTN
jgi:signal transduction histidine kinase